MSASLRALVPLVLAIALAGSACQGSDGEDAADGARTTETVVPARTRDEWANRLYHTFLKDVDEDLRVLNLLRTPQTRLYLYTRNEETIRTLTTRMNDLQTCSEKLRRVGRPPGRSAPLRLIYESIEVACPRYERVASIVLEAIPLLSSGRESGQAAGRRLLVRARAPSQNAAIAFAEALQVIDQEGLLANVTPTPRG